MARDYEQQLQKLREAEQDRFSRWFVDNAVGMLFADGTGKSWPVRQTEAQAIEQGVRRERILLDPGLGFGKTYGQNLDLIRRLSELRRLEFPLLVGASRKSFTGRLLGLPVEQRLETSLATLVLMVANGADVVRVHDVGASVRAARMTDEIVRADR